MKFKNPELRNKRIGIANKKVQLKLRKIEREFCNAEKISLIKGLYKDDKVKFTQARLARIFLISRERIRQILAIK